MVRAAQRMRALMEKGKKDFQVRYIRWSYRIRGRVARIHRKRIARAMVTEDCRRSRRGVRGGGARKKQAV